MEKAAKQMQQHPQDLSSELDALFEVAQEHLVQPLPPQAYSS